MSKITVVMSVLNEEKKIERTLRSVSWADSLIIVDNGSNDATVAIAKRFTRNVYHRKNNLMLNVNKNFGFSKATTDWILSLDADEEITKELAGEIQSVVLEYKSDSNIQGYWLSRKNIIFGKWMSHGLWWPDKQLRLFKKSRGRFPCKHVHEYLELDGESKDLLNPYIHYNYESVSQYIQKMDRIYTESELQKLVRSGYVSTWHDALRFPVSDFLKIYFAQEGYKDGLHGLVLSMLQAFYSFIVYVKLWEYRKYPQVEIPLPGIIQELGGTKREFNFWLNKTKMKETPNILTRLWYKARKASI